MDKKHQINVWYVAAAIMLLLLFQSWWSQISAIQAVPYSRFEQMLDDGLIDQVAVRENTLQGRLKSPTPEGREFVLTTRVDPEIAALLSKSGVEFAGTIESHFISNLLSWVMPLIFFAAIWLFFIRKVADRQGFGGLMSVGKSKAKVYVETDTKVSFADVAGVDEAKDELKEIVAFLKAPQEYGRLGAHIPKGILLVGPPGTGKTLLARAVAGEAGVPFFSISGSEFVEMFVGVGAARVRDLFEEARKTKPAIIFIDELDALGRARGAGPLSGGHDEKEQTLNQLLSELDGFDPSVGVVLLAATNRPEILDPALLRAGRFDRQVLVDRPDKVGRLAILKVHIGKVTVGPDLSLEHVAALTPGFSGADLANLVNEAALLATRRRGDNVTMADFDNAIERIVAGLEKRSRVMSETERRTVAYHEMGHALVAASLPGVDPVHKISIIPRGIGALGYTMQRPTEDRFLMSRAELKNKMAVLVGGRTAEELAIGEISTGAADDLDKVTDIARHMVMRYGMAESVGQAVYEAGQPTFLGDGTFGRQSHDYSEETARLIDQAVKQLVEEAFDTARAILTERHEDLETSAALLMERETLTPKDLPFLVPPKSEDKVAAQ